MKHFSEKTEHIRTGLRALHEIHLNAFFPHPQSFVRRCATVAAPLPPRRRRALPPLLYRMSTTSLLPLSSQHCRRRRLAYLPCSVSYLSLCHEFSILHRFALRIL
jgi:hypothetical protein